MATRIEYGAWESLVSAQAVIDRYGMDAVQDWRTGDGLPILHVAASKSSTRDLQYLINAGIDLHTTDYQGNTALHYAQSKESVKILLDAGASLRTQNHLGQTALHWASYQRNGAKCS